VNILVTGGAGFIGSNFIRYALERQPEISIVNYDKLTYAGNLENLNGVEDAFPGRYEFVRGDICDGAAVRSVLRQHKIDRIINFAAETHVDRSIMDAGAFVSTNVVGTKTLLDAALESKCALFFQISTDEVYGSLGEDGAFSEDHPIAPNSPYSASKAAADHFVRAYHKTYGLPAVITRCSNNYGPYQFPEKLIPVLISNAREEKELPIYGDGRNVRDWIHVDDHSRAVIDVLMNGRIGEVYNIGGQSELENIYIAEQVLDILGKSRDLIRFVKDRPGHDRRYAMDFTKIRTELGWEPEILFERGLRETVQWYVDHDDWVQRIKTQEYLEYYEKNYAGR